MSNGIQDLFLSLLARLLLVGKVIAHGNSFLWARQRCRRYVTNSDILDDVVSKTKFYTYEDF